EFDVCQLQTFGSLGEVSEVILPDVLGDDGAAWAQEAREADRVVAAASTDVADRHAWRQFKKTGNLSGLIQRIAVLLGGAPWADNLCNGTPRGRKLPRSGSRRRKVTNIGGACASCAKRDKERYCAGQCHHVVASCTERERLSAMA